jgi:hypothetical protein
VDHNFGLITVAVGSSQCAKLISSFCAVCHQHVHAKQNITKKEREKKRIKFKE